MASPIPVSTYYKIRAECLLLRDEVIQLKAELAELLAAYTSLKHTPVRSKELRNDLLGLRHMLRDIQTSAPAVYQGDPAAIEEELRELNELLEER